MIKLSRIVSAFCAGVLVCFLLSGCSKPTTPEDKPVDNGVPTTVAPDAGDKAAMPGGGPPKK